MKNIFKAAGIAVIAFAVGGCNSDSITIEDNAQHEEYVRNFVKTFGVPDPDHNYAMAKSAGLHVTTKKGGHVTVTAMVGGTEYLFADLDVPAGTHALPVTIPASVKQLIVKSDRGVQTVATDATVDIDKAPDSSRASADGEFPILYGAEYNILDESKYGEMMLNPVDNEPPYLCLEFGKGSVTRNFVIDKVLASIGKDNTAYSFTLTDPDESKGEILRFDPQNPAPHETILTCQGATSYYIFPIYWKKDKNGNKDYEIILHKASEGINDLKSPYIISFADEGEDKSKTPFPHLGYSETSVNKYYVYPYGDHEYTEGIKTNYKTNWDLIKFGEDRNNAYDKDKSTFMISRGIKINMRSSKDYAPGFALAVRSNFSNGKPGSFVSSAPFYNTHSDAWGQNYYDASLHYLYLAASATLRWDVVADGTTGDKIDPWIMDKKIDATSKYHTELGEEGTRPDSIPMSIKSVWSSSNQWGKLRTNQPMLLGFSAQPDRPASTDIRDYCDVILLITPHHKTIKWGDSFTGVWYRHLYAHLPKPMEWTLAAEDLGGSDDWDFNDVVFTFTDVIRNLKSANWLSSQAMISGPNGAGSVRTITIKPKATGGTMPIYITLTAKGILSPDQIPEMASDGETMFSVANAAIKEELGLSDGGTDIEDSHTYILGTEVHKWLGARSYTQFVNVGSNRANVNAKEVQIIIPTDLDLGDEVRIGQAGGSQENKPLYGFGVLVDKENELNYDAFADDGLGYMKVDNLTMGEGTYLIGAPNDDKDVNVPQMILVQGDWQWPTERTNILEAYPNFKAWIGDHTNSDWINNPEEGKVTKK